MCMKYFWVAAFTALTFVAWASSRQVIVVNKPGSSGWHWETKKTPGKDISGWTTRGNPTRYAACDVSLPSSNPHPDNWLISDQISIKDANRIDITVHYFITSCSTFPNSGGSYCENVFDLYINHSDQLIADKSQYPDPLRNRVAYEKTAAIRQATNKRFSETINVLVKAKYVILAFHNYGACSTLFSVKVTYNFCPEETLINTLMTLPRTVAPANDSKPIRVEGSCAKDAVRVLGSLFVYCQSSGDWSMSGLQGRCICKEDFQNIEGKCQACPDGMHNDENGFNCSDKDECVDKNICGSHSVCENLPGSFACNCFKGFKSKNEDGKNCYDIDECEEGTHSCPKFSKCKNKNGSFDCPCRDGFERTAKETCSEICIRKCDENSYCQNGLCLCRRGFSMGFDFKCQPKEGLLGSGMSLQSPAILLMTALLWRLALI